MSTETTILDENLNLTVRTDGDLVVMTGDPGDGTWFFSVTEALDLAVALIDHAVAANGDRVSPAADGLAFARSMTEGGYTFPRDAPR